MMKALPSLALLLTLLTAGRLSAQEASTPAILSGTLPPNMAAVASSAPATEETEADAPASPSLAVADTASTVPHDDLGEGAAPPHPQAQPDKDLDFLQRSHLILAKLLENHREVDPFGLVMDPSNTKATPLLADQYRDTEETQALSVSALQSALLTLPITGVYPQKGQLVIGARTFSVGGQFGMKLQELTIRLRFEGIRNGELFFKDLETQEVTSIPYNTRPAEFEPIARKSKQPLGSGIVPMSDLYIAN